MEQSQLDQSESLLPQEESPEALSAVESPQEPEQQAQEPAPSEEAPAVEAKPESVAAPVEESPAEAEPAKAEPVVEPAKVEPIKYETMDALVEAFPKLSPEVRAHVEPVLNLVKESYSGYLEAKQRLDDYYKELTELGFEDVAVHARRIQEVSEQNNVLAEDISVITTQAFNRLHPELATAPAEFKNAFANLIETSLHTKFADEPTPLARMEAALDWLQWKTQTKLSAPAAAQPKAMAAPTPPAPVVPKPAPVSTVTGRRQAALAEGSQAFNGQRPSVDERTYDEILSEHEHLLDDN